MVKPLVSPALLARGFGKGTDFEVYTGAATADESVDRPIVRMIGSSTVKDLQGDTMMITALEDMTKIDPEMTIWLNHRYDVPDDVFGKLAEQPAIRAMGGIADLHLAAEADFSRPVSKARDVYTQISKGKIRQGCSIGCQVLDYSFADDNDPFSPIFIHRVYTVEFSIVGIPANQRAWVENAVKGLFSRALIEGRGEDALRLAPAMKSMFWRDYDTTLRYIELKSLRGDLERVQERGTPSPRIIFNFDRNKGFEGFALLGSEETMKPLSFAETQDLMNKGLPDLEENYDPDTTKAACGKTSWPLAEIGAEWTGSKAKSEIFEWAGGDDFSPSKAKQGFLYCGDDPKVRSSYKMPFCYKGDSGLKIVPLGVRACANVLSGGRGGGDFGGADGAMKSKVKTMYGRINSQFHPDPEWTVPWEKDEKSLVTHYEDEMAFMQTLGFEVVEQGETFFIKSADGELTPWLSKILDTENGSDLIRQDLEDEVEDEEKTKGVTINDDGSHEKMTGKHSHKHPNYGNKADGDMHSHEHEHQDDSNHRHSHDGEKSAESEIGQKHLTINEQRAAEGLDPIVEVITQNAPTPEQLAYLSLYNDLGKRLGFPEHTLQTKCDLVPTQGDAGIVRSMLSALDDCSDQMMAVAQRADGYVDTLMGMMGVPDVNDTGEAGEDSVYPPLVYSLRALTIKEGKEISGKNASLVQNIHDTAAALHPPVCKGVSGDGTAHQGEGTTVEDAQAEARAMGQGQGYDNMASLNAMGVTMKEMLTKSFEGLNVKALVEQKVTDAVDAAMSEQRANMELLNREQQVAMHQVARLKNVPLGRPTNLSGRTVVPKDDERVATYEEMLSAGNVNGAPGTLKELEASTEIVEKEIYVNGGQRIKSRYRRWPESVGGLVGSGLRPPLTGNQKSLMLPEEWSAYNLGGEVAVPLIDDPFAK